MTHRHHDIAAIEKAVTDQCAANVRKIRAVQDKCPHDKIVASTLGSGARRICCACGLEELNRYYSWPGQTEDGGLYEFMRPAGLRTVLNGEFVKVDDVCSYRVRL